MFGLEISSQQERGEGSCINCAFETVSLIFFPLTMFISPLDKKEKPG